jgi:osmotically-inducible protein OsmY
MTTTLDKTDVELKTNVLAELKYEPSVKITDIGVLVKDGTVTLNGYANSYGEKWDAVRAAKRVAGVKAIADDIEVKLPFSIQRTDGDIAAAAATQIDWSSTIPTGAVKVTVRAGRISLEGTVEWQYQRTAAENVVKYITGLKGVDNLIKIQPKPAGAEVESAIKLAFERSAVVDARKIKVTTSGNKVTLRGSVRNYAESDEAERVAWAAPGVFFVDNQLQLDWSWGITK